MDFIDKVTEAAEELGFTKIELRPDGDYDCWNFLLGQVDTYSKEELEWEMDNTGFYV